MEDDVRTTLMDALKTAYQGMRQRGDVSPAAFKELIEPLLAGVSEQDRSALGGLLWKEWWDLRETANPSPYAGLAYRLAPPVGGS